VASYSRQITVDKVEYKVDYKVDYKVE